MIRLLAFSPYRALRAFASVAWLLACLLESGCSPNSPSQPQHPTPSLSSADPAPVPGDTPASPGDASVTPSPSPTPADTPIASTTSTPPGDVAPTSREKPVSPPGDSTPTPEKSSSDKPCPDKPSSAKPSGDKPSGDQPPPDPSPAGKPPAGQASADTPASGDKSAPAEPRKVQLLVPDKKFRTEAGVLRVSYDDLDLLKVLNMDPVTPDCVEKMPPWLKQLDGKRIRIRGFMYPPLSATDIPQFVLARDNQICCFGRDPKPYDVIKVQLTPGTTTDYIENKPFDVIGQFHLNPLQDSDGNILRLYRIDDAKIIAK